VIAPTRRLVLAALLGAVSLAAQNATHEPAQDLIDAGHYRRAIPIVEARLQTHPSDAEALCQMATLKQIAGDLPAAQSLAEKALAEKAIAVSASARYHYRLAEILGEMAQNAGILHQVSIGLKFKKEADLTLSLDPNLVGALKDEMMFYLHAPGIAGGDKGKAYATAEQIMKIDPVEGYFARIALGDEKQAGNTETLLLKAVEVQPDSFDARIRLGNFCASNKKPDEAERHAREAIRIQPDRVNGYALLTVALVQQSKWPELDAVLREAEKIVFDNLLPYYRAGNTCLGLKVELPRAEQYFRKYLTQTPELRMPTLADAHWRLGLVLEGLARKNEAIAELRTAVKLEPNSHAGQDLKRLLR
jgi:tetratricopeptide (TPR) repeat protein